MTLGLERIVDCPVYRSSVKRKDTCNRVVLGTGKTGGEGGRQGAKGWLYTPTKSCGLYTPPASGHMSRVPGG